MDTENAQDVQVARDAYVECADWADAPRDESGEEEETVGFHPDTIRGLESHVDQFLADEEVARDVAGMDAGQVGHDLWLTRNGHGAGFWDRGLGAVGERLSAAARAMGSAELYVGDDGWTYVA